MKITDTKIHAGGSGKIGLFQKLFGKKIAGKTDGKSQVDASRQGNGPQSVKPLSSRIATASTGDAQQKKNCQCSSAVSTC